jgi:ADP-dependent NAD(P)H-hydrate dehydratase / NAD(P)H-hydrate epimerase
MMVFALRLADDGTILRPRLTPPDADTHKYRRGHAMIWSGPPLRTGASRLSAHSALAVGAGLVTIIGDRAALHEHAGHVTAIMLRQADAGLDVIDERVTALAIGPGAGRDIGQIVCKMLDRGIPTVLDADAITAFESNSTQLFNYLHEHDVMTPHVGEFGRLFPDIGLDDGKQAALVAAQRSGATVLLKGRDTVIAAPDGRCAVNHHASPWLATAGSGDVLTGLICGLLAQGAPAFDAACIGAWLHGDIGVRAGPGLTADTMVGHIPLVLRCCLDDANGDGAGSRT